MTSGAVQADISKFMDMSYDIFIRGSEDHLPKVVGGFA
jgi:hypothetical protein